MSSGGKRKSRLRTLERWRSLELEQAQAERAIIDSMVREERAAVTALERDIEATRVSARALMAGARALTAEELRRVQNYAAWQSRVLAQRSERLEDHESRAEEAQNQLTRRFEALSSVERLRERDARERATQLLRGDQKQIDAEALLLLEWSDT